MRSFRIESKRFDLIKEGDGIDSVSLFEAGRITRHSVFMGKDGARWLGKCIEENIRREDEKAFIRTFRESDKGYVIHRFTNKNGRYLELSDYGRGGCKGRLAIPEGQKQSGWRGFNKELQLVLNPSLIDSKERKNHYRQGIPVEDNIQKRIPAKERLGPAVSYAESVRAPAKHQDANGKPSISPNPISKISKTPEITHTRDIVNDDEKGTAKMQERFLGSVPYRRIEAAIISCPKLTISLNTDGKRTVTWGGPANHVEMATTKEEGHGMGLEVKKPNRLVLVGNKEKFSGPSLFERGESSTTTHKPKPTQMWVPKIGGAVLLNEGPQQENKLVPVISAENDVAEDFGVSRISSLGFTPIAFIPQKSTFILFRTFSVSDHRRTQVDVGINFSVPRNLVGPWGHWLGEIAMPVFMGELNMVLADSAEGETHKESHCLAVVPRDISPEDLPEENLLDITPLNSYRSESIPSDQSEWVRQNMEVFSKKMGVSIEGYEVEAMALFTAIEQRWRQTGVTQTIVCMTQQRARRGVRELRNLSSSVNYGTPLTGGGRRSRELVLSQ